MELLEKIEGRIGVWGYGIVGQAITRFLVQHKKPIALFDTQSKQLSDNYIPNADIIRFHGIEQLPAFFESCSSIIPSPGIDLTPYAPYNNNYITELDLFADYWHKPLIAVTGSVGKTTITTILGHLLNQNNMPTAVGGNIGIGTSDLLTQQDKVIQALLELSSFQLEHTCSFKPTLAIISNLYANHLDRHGTLDNYWNAKAQITAHQEITDLLITDWALKNRIRALSSRATIWYIGEEPLSTTDLLLPHEAYWYTTESEVRVVRKNDYQTWQKPKELFSATFSQNALIIYAALMRLYNNNPFVINFKCDGLSLPHRREVVAHYNNILFVNDSKATSTIAMLAAVTQYSSQDTYLLMGGLSKGIDRTTIFADLPDSVKEIICFGAEAEILCSVARTQGRNASAHADLQAAFIHTVGKASPNSVVLLSPSGSSYDLYKNYEERGNHFKQLVRDLCV